MILIALVNSFANSFFHMQMQRRAVRSLDSQSSADNIINNASSGSTDWFVIATLLLFAGVTAVYTIHFAIRYIMARKGRK